LRTLVANQETMRRERHNPAEDICMKRYVDSARACSQRHNIRYGPNGYYPISSHDRRVSSLDLNRLVESRRETCCTYNVKERSPLENASSSFRALTPVESPEPIMQMRIVGPDHFEVTFERCVVCHVEANQRGVEANVGFGDVVAKEERLMIRLRKVLL
jgi:hypothetical protein